ncbi:ParA family protein [Geomonas paludis]|uniref:ParA family protein n=1 Tax=Geomonas paludis TaxID=2740185 RepID=A0ABY4LKH0_9BACT|nr:ParA family protein [Geomonas paludis]UPU37510.1 ParA family protein [Geomonas paludis]
MRTIALLNQKGGVGKTTCAANIGAGLALLGRKVLLVDMDPQANLTEGLGVALGTGQASVYDCLINCHDVESAVVRITEGLDILPSCIDLAGAEAELISLQGREWRLKTALSTVDGYDYIIIDAPPSLGQLALNTMYAVREIFIPLQTEYYPLKGVAKLLETVAEVQKWSNTGTAIAGIVGTCYDSRKNLNKEVVAQFREHFGELAFRTVIRDNVALAEAPAASLDIFRYAKSSRGAEDYAALCQEIIAMEETGD